MAKVYGFRDQLARPLVDLARERLTRPHIKTGVKYPERKLPALRGYVLQPQETIAAASKDSDGLVTLGSGSCWILRRDQASGESSGDDGKELKYQLDDNGNRVTVAAYNLCPETVGDGSNDIGGSGSVGSGGCTPTSLVYAVQDTFGDLYITERCELPCPDPPVCFISDTFSRGDSTDLGETEVGDVEWEELSGDWEITGGNLAPTGTEPAQPVWVAVVETDRADEIEVKATVRTTSGWPAFHGVVARVVDKDNLWLLGISQGINEVAIYRRLSGNWLKVAGSSITISHSVDYRLLLRIRGDTLTGFVNELQYVTHTEATHNTATKAGVRTHNNTAEFADFDVCNIVDESSSGSDGSSSSSTACITCFDGLCLDDIPTVDNADDVAYVLGETNAGCLVKVPLSLCTSGGSSSSSGS